MAALAVRAVLQCRRRRGAELAGLFAAHRQLLRVGRPTEPEPERGAQPRCTAPPRRPMELSRRARPVTAGGRQPHAAAIDGILLRAGNANGAADESDPVDPYAR